MTFHPTMRGILAVRAAAQAGEPPAVFRELKDAFEQFKAQYDGRDAAYRGALDKALLDISALKIGGGAAGGDGRLAPDDPAYTANFRDWMRAGEQGAPEAAMSVMQANKTGMLANIQASMSVGSPADGGYLAPIEWDRQIIAAQVPKSPMRRIAAVVQTGVRAYTTLWNVKGWGSGWVGETAVRPETLAATLQPITFANGEIYAMPAATQQLLEDSQINMDQWIADEIADEFATQESLAFIAGNGTNKPHGLLTYAVGGTSATVHPGGALDTVTVASATAITIDELVDFFYGLAAPYRQNSAWLMNSTTAALLTKMKDADGNFIWRESLAAGQPATLLGRPVEMDENMPAVAAGALPIAFGDFQQGYLINDRLGVSILRDPYTSKPYVLFYARKRVGGGVRDPRAIRVLKMAAV